MTRPWTAILLCIALITWATACGSEGIQGEPTAVAPISTTTKPPRPLGPRPKDISLVGVDPCQLLTDQQLDQLRYNKERRPATGSQLGELRCGASNFSGAPPNYGSLLSLVINEDISAWLTPERQAGLASSTQISIAGYPALQTTGKLLKDDCQVLVDVADGQYLDVFSRPGVGRGTSPEPYCVEAKRVAEMVMQTLLAKK